MWLMMAARNTTSLRYYLWADDGHWRITHRLHSELVSGKVVLRQYAGTKQKIVEVFIHKVRGSQKIVEARGGVYSFDARGRLDVASQAEAASVAVDGAKAPALEGNSIAIKKPSAAHCELPPEHLH